MVMTVRLESNTLRKFQESNQLIQKFIEQKFQIFPWSGEVEKPEYKRETKQ